MAVLDGLQLLQNFAGGLGVARRFDELLQALLCVCVLGFALCQQSLKRQDEGVGFWAGVVIVRLTALLQGVREAKLQQPAK